MYRARFSAVIPVAILVSTISLSARMAFCQADSRWAVSLGAGLTDELAYRDLSYSFGDYHEHIGFSGLAVAGAAYRLTDHASLRADMGYIGYQKAMQLNLASSNAGVLGVSPRGSALTAQIPFLSGGARLYFAGPASARPRLYIEALPTLWVTRWRERVETREHYDLYGNYYPHRVDQDAFTILNPGFTAGAGVVGSLVGRTRLDLGFRYLFSIGPGQHQLGQYSSGDFKGLRQVALTMSLHLPL
jgi:hypothetical protein